MATGLISKAKVHAGALLVGGVPSDGGKGSIGGTGTPTLVKKIAAVVSGTITPGAIAANAETTATVTVTGAVAGDIVVATPNASLGAAHYVWSAQVTANDTVTIFIQADGTGGTPTPGTWTIMWFSIV